MKTNLITFLVLAIAALALSQELSPSPSPSAMAEDFKGKHLVLRNYTVGESLSNNEVIDTAFKAQILNSDRVDYYDGIWTFDNAGAKKNWVDLAIFESKADADNLLGASTLPESGDLTLENEHRGDVLNFAEKSGDALTSDLNKWVVIHQYDIATGAEGQISSSIDSDLLPQIQQLTGFDKWMSFVPGDNQSRLITIGLFDTQQDANNAASEEQRLVSSGLSGSLTHVNYDIGQVKDFFRKGMAEETASPSPLPSA